MVSQSSTRTSASDEQRAGILHGIAAYGLWGVLPVYFIWLEPSSAFEIVVWRIIFGLLFCLAVLGVTRKWRPLVSVLRQPRVVLILGIAGAIIIVNWQLYIYAVTSGQVLEAALGYFINPIFTVLFGVILLKERLRIAQWVAVGISVIAVLVLVFNYGAFPWISVSIACLFGLYGLVKNRVGPGVDAVSGLTIETAWLTPIGIVALIWMGATTGITFGAISPMHTALLVGSGAATVIPLIFFSAAARRLPLAYMGLLQYLCPVIQFVLGVYILNEAMPAERWLGFGIVWVALMILTVDMIVSGRAPKRSSLEPA